MDTAGLPAEGPVQLGAVRLPAGRRLFGWDDNAPQLWATSEPVADAGRVWQVLAGMHPDTGLVPILLAFLDEGNQGRPWDEGELNYRCDLAAVRRLDAAAMFGQSWADSLPGPLADAQAVAAELWAMSDEFWPIDKPGTAVWDVGETAERILEIPIWSLWLD